METVGTHNILGWRPRLGVLGGMGPLATVDFYARLVRATPAQRDQEHMPVVIMSDPQIPDRSDAIMHRTTRPVLKALLERLADLEKAGVDAVAIPCNTAHFWLPELREHTDRPFIAMPAAAASAFARAADRANASRPTAMLLGTRGTVWSGIYANPLAAQGIDFIATPEDVQAHVDAAIQAVKAGRAVSGAEALKAAINEACEAHDPTGFILACTELPLITPPTAEDGFVLVDATDALVQACVAWATQEHLSDRKRSCALS
jgi:aspartate racemase